MAVTKQIRLREGLASEWTSSDPTLLDGEYGYESDTKRSKVGDGATAWSSLEYINYPLRSSKVAGFTVADADADVFEVTTGASDRTATLPTLADNLGRKITIHKIDSGAGAIILDGEGAETIEGDTTKTLYGQDACMTVEGTTNCWRVVESRNGRPASGAVRVGPHEYIFAEDSELDYSSSFTDGMSAATVTFSQLPANTIEITAKIQLSDTGTTPNLNWKRSSGATDTYRITAQFADGGTNVIRGTFPIPTNDNSIYATLVTADSDIEFKIIGYKTSA